MERSLFGLREEFHPQIGQTVYVAIVKDHYLRDGFTGQVIGFTKNGLVKVRNTSRGVRMVNRLHIEPTDEPT